MPRLIVIRGYTVRPFIQREEKKEGREEKEQSGEWGKIIQNKGNY